MKCENILCKYWSGRECLIKEEITINKNALCDTWDAATAEQVENNKDWLKMELIRYIDNMDYKRSNTIHNK